MLNIGEAERVPTVWVDTNVMLEIYSHGDHFDADDRGDTADVEQRRTQMRGSFWMAMALCQRSVRSVTFQHENERNILRMAPPGSIRGSWTAAVAYVLADGGVLDGWERMMTNVGAHLSNPGRDQLMIDECVNGGMTFISRDRGARGHALAAGIQPMTPEGYGASVLSDEQARVMFMERLRVAADNYPSRGPRHEHDERISSARAIYQRYEAVWMAPAAPT